MNRRVSDGGVTLVPCPECEGESVTTSKVGGIEEGGCSTCEGTGLVPESEVEE